MRLLALVLLSVACSGEPLTEGMREPLQVQDTQFRKGALPGLPPLSSDEVNAGVAPTSPTVTSVNLANSLIPVGDPGRSFNGRTTPDAVAVGVRLSGLGTGYWLLPTRTADVINDGELEWSLRAAFSHDVPTGKRRLLFAALDAQGHSGTQAVLDLCLASEVPDNGNACDPKTAPPALVVSLHWDAAVDLDLRVVTPAGKIVDPKHPSTALADQDGNVDPNADGTGLIGYDSFANCVNDGRRREDLVFQTTPAPGTYLIYANLYDACGASGVDFDVSLHTAEAGSAPETFVAKETFSQAGQLEAVHANGGAKLGMFLTSFVVH